MPEYTVAWTTQIDSDSPEDAARQARQKQLDPESTADVFHVSARGSGTVEIDLSALDGRPI
ncbi:hypothetical protein [Streptomyces sp. NPDC020681]|uniref:hypothetical protein n=1 Tax=Streptomyces sp. NPDC020681 TaxID=3365083 RepID=UPI0037BBE19A